MSRSNALLFLPFFLAGCASPREPVYVDLDRAIQAEQADAILEPTLPSFSVDSIRTGYRIPPMPARTVADDGASARLAKAERELENERLRVVDELGNRLMKAYAKEVERFRLEDNVRIERDLRNSYEAVGEKISQHLHVYAEQSWPLSNRLALLVGFPFPESTAVPKPAPENRVAAKRYAEAMDLYARLRQLRAEFNRSVDAELASHFEQASQLRLASGLEVVEKLDEAARRARREAQEALAQVDRSIEVTLAKLGSIRLREVAGSQAVVEANATVLPESIGGTAPNETIISRRGRAQEDLDIWLGAHALRRAPTPFGVRDATETFIQWRRSMKDSR